jgi:hypothetical protein
LKDVDTMVRQLLVASTNSHGQSFSLTPEAIAHIKQGMRHDSNVEIEYYATMGDAKAFKLASQIRDIFDSQGFKNDEIIQAVFIPPPSGVNFVVKDLSTTSPSVLEPMFKIFLALGLKPTASRDATLQQSKIKIIIGSEP